MPLFRKKPVVIEAVQWNGSNLSEIAAFVTITHTVVHEEGLPVVIVIPTLERSMGATLNDWIIKGVKGEFYPCKPDIFAATYEPAEGGH